MYKTILEHIKSHHTIIIHRHSRPDGDAVGSQIGLKEAIKATYPDKKVYAVGDVNAKYDFIGNMDFIPDDVYDKALVIVVDTPEESMISDGRYRRGVLLIKIDHHIDRSAYADVEYIDTSYESCAGMIADMVVTGGLKLNSTGARALFSGIVTDSGRFRYSSVNARTFFLTAKLLEYGFDFTEVYDNLYIEDFKFIALRAAFVQKIRFSKQNVAYIMTSADELRAYGIDTFTASRGMVNTMAGIKGVGIWVNFTEDPETGLINAELRSNKININEVAVKFGGGGHRNASGALLRSFAECNDMLKELNLIAEGKNI